MHLVLLVTHSLESMGEVLKVAVTVAFGRLAVSNVVVDNAREGTLCFVVVNFRVPVVIHFSHMYVLPFTNTHI